MDRLEVALDLGAGGGLVGLEPGQVGLDLGGVALVADQGLEVGLERGPPGRDVLLELVGGGDWIVRCEGEVVAALPPRAFRHPRVYGLKIRGLDVAQLLEPLRLHTRPEPLDHSVEEDFLDCPFPRLP